MFPSGISSFKFYSNEENALLTSVMDMYQKSQYVSIVVDQGS